MSTYMEKLNMKQISINHTPPQPSPKEDKKKGRKGGVAERTERGKGIFTYSKLGVNPCAPEL